MAIVVGSTVKYNGPVSATSKFAGYVGKTAKVKSINTVGGIQLVGMVFVGETAVKSTTIEKLTLIA